jgi:hypothetical protein
VFGSSAELIFAIEKAADISRKGGDPKRFRSYLQRAEEVSQEIGDTRQHLQYLAMYANQLYLDGMIEDAQSLFHDVIIRAQKSSFPLLVIAEGAILSGILLSQQRWLAAVSLSVIMESASRERKNWIGVSCAIMTRASAWFAQGMQEACIRLLLETGRDFHEQGAVAALNLIKARLAEMRSLLGEERFHELCSQI